jgi:hypothetical protein
MLLVDCNCRGVRNAVPDGVHFCEQIGVTEDEFKDALGRKWLTSTEFPLVPSNHARLDMLGLRLLTINPYSDYGSETESPAADSSLIVSGAASSAAGGRRGPSLESASSLDRKTCTANSGARTRQKDDSST